MYRRRLLKRHFFSMTVSVSKSNHPVRSGDKPATSRSETELGNIGFRLEGEKKENLETK